MHAKDINERLSSLPPLKDVIAAHGLRAQKSLGQNFLLDLNITDKIAGMPGELSGHTVFEIGPGPGGLTRSLLKTKAEKIIAVEFDTRCIEALKSLTALAGDRLRVLHADALNTDLTSLCAAPRAIVANLPYNIATPLLIGWLKQIYEDPESFSSMTLMFQKEVAERITAASGNKTYGRLSVLSQWLCACRIAYTLPPQAFTPPPKISSAVVHFKPRILKNKPPFDAVERITAAAFHQRRKMIRSSLSAYKDALLELNLDETLRAENLEIAHVIAIASKARR